MKNTHLNDPPTAPGLVPGDFFLYGCEMAIVYFFNDLVLCNHCGKETLGIVEEFSSKVECDYCGYAIIDYEEGDAVVIFTFDDKEVVH